jgi:hypothetical protein
MTYPKKIIGLGQFEQQKSKGTFHLTFEEVSRYQENCDNINKRGKMNDSNDNGQIH